MDHKTVGNVHNGVLLSHKEKQHYIIYRKMDGTGKYCAKCDYSVTKSKKPNALPNMLKLGRKTDIEGTSVQRGEILEE